MAAIVRLLRCRRRRQNIRRLPRKYLIGCGALFVSYTLLLFCAIGLAKGGQQVLEVGLLNYLWPALTLLLSLVLLGKTASLLLVPGTLLALAGVFLVLTQEPRVAWASFSQNLASNPLAYSLGLAAAISWALYSALTRKWADSRPAGAVDVFLPATAIILLLVCPFVEEPRAWRFRSVAEAAFLGGATYLAYGFWDTAMRAGNFVLVAAASYLAPFFSTVVCCVYLRITTTLNLWVGCGLLIMGGLLSWLSISEARPPGIAQPADPGAKQ
jgi:drug/metabolite transporter (DMT)-like permease